MQRGLDISVGENYHVYNRGVEKRKIFTNKGEYERFLRLLFLCNSTVSVKYDRVKNALLKDIDRGEPLVAIGAYTLMPNHFHILLQEIIEGGISAFMEKLTTAYAMFFNKSHGRVGSLFQGPYKAEHANNDEYLKYLYSYIHLNPMKLLDSKWKEKGIADLHGAQDFLERYRFSSYQEYIGIEREESLILTREVFPEYFQETTEFKDFIADWLSFSPHQPV
jgi:putative transposase